MSFWPFGQNANNSNISKILDDYFLILHGLENIEHQQGDKQPSSYHIDKVNPISEDVINTLNNNMVSHIPLIPTQRNQLQSFHEDQIELGGSNSLPNSSDSGLGDSSIVSKTSLNKSFINHLLDDPELLNELTKQNNTLLDFICFGYFYDENDIKVQNLNYLVDQLIESIDQISREDFTNDYNKGDNEEADRRYLNNENNSESQRFESYKNNIPDDSYMNKAILISEILSLDVWLLSESLVKSTNYILKIWSIIYHEHFQAEKSPLVSIFLKINQNLLSTRQDQYLNFIRSKNDLVDDFLKYLEISPIMDFFLKIISTDKQESPTGIIELVYEQDLVFKLLNFFDNEKFSPSIQTCAGDLLKAIIVISANAPLDEMSIGPNSLTRQLCSEESINYLLDAIINKRGTSLVASVSIVIELIRKNNSDYDQVNLLTTTLKTHPPSVRDPIYLGTLLKRFSLALSDFKRVLLDLENSNKLQKIPNQLGQFYKPLGFERFKIVELIAELLHCSNMGLMNSKKAEQIADERDKFRQDLIDQLKDALSDLDINSNHIGDSITVQYNTDTIQDLDSEFDESFDIPYVNPNQNEKLRNNPTISDLFKIQLYDTQLLPLIVKLFIQYPWNNFWHNVIFDIIQQIFNGRMDFSYNSFLVYSLFNNRDADKFVLDGSLNSCSENFVDFQITRDLILQGYRNSHEFYEKHNTTLGYMGHLVLIAEEIVKFSKVYKIELISPDIYSILQDPDWFFYSEDILNDTRMMYSKILGGSDYVNGSDGNIMTDISNVSMCDSDESNCKNELLNMNDINEEYSNQNDQFSYSTQSDLHKKLKENLIRRARDEIDRKNKEKGVIILGDKPTN